MIHTLSEVRNHSLLTLIRLTQVIYIIIYELLEVQGRKIAIMERRRVGGVGRSFY